MVVLHGLWGETGFFIWGEADNVNSSKRRGRPRKIPGGTHHPFQTPVSALVDSIHDICPNTVWEKHMQIEDKWIIIPSGKYIPQGSPWLSMEENQNEYQLGRWQIKGIMLPAPVFMEEIVLNYDETRMMESRGIMVADDWRYWMLCNRFLLRLLCAQKFIPYLEQDNAGQWQAIWQPILVDPEDRYIVNELIKKMPPICCSIMQDCKLPMKLNSPKSVFTDFLKNATDQMVRRWLTGLPQVNEKAPVERKLLFSLHREERMINAPQDEIMKLAQGLREWVSPLTDSDENFRLCFQLHEPKKQETSWYLSFHLQALDDPNLLVPARKVWEIDDERVVIYGKILEHPQEFFLESLGKALNIYPLLERALLCPRPEGCTLSLDEAYLFLRQASVVLQENGIGVLVPQWWKEKNKIGPRLRMKVRPVSDKDSLLGLNSLVEYDWQLAIGDQIIGYDDIKSLASMERMLKKVGDQWIEVNPEQIRSILQWLDGKGRGGTIRLGEALNIVADKSDEEPFHEIDGESWVDVLLKGVAGKESYTVLNPPSGFRGELRPYQIRGYSWLLFLCRRGFGACLADDMGLGKTVQLIAMLLYEREKLGVTGTTLLVCPTSVVGNWQRETARFAPGLKTFIHHGEGRPSCDDFGKMIKGVDLVITTYNLIHREKNIFSSVSWEGIVLDEAQNIKNPAAKQTKAIKGLNGRYRIALTGTPIENRLRDLWSIMDFINPGYLGKWERFKRKFSIPIERYGDLQKAEQLKMLTQPFILRRLKTDKDIIRDLPEKQEMKVYCNLTEEQVTLYHDVVEELIGNIEKLDGIERKGMVLATLTKLKQICNHPSQYLDDQKYTRYRSGKLERLVEMLEEVLEEGDRALIFTQYTKMGRIIQHCLREYFKCEVFFLHGGVSRKLRENMVKKFQRKEGPSIFVLSLKAGGVGLNLTNANHVFHYDRWWNPAVENQATDRAFRIGQIKNVQVHTFICSGTLEEKIDLLIEQKKDLAGMIIGSGEGWLTELDNSTLKELLTLE